MKSIKSKLIFMILGLITLISLCFSIIVFYISSNALHHTYEASLAEIALQSANEIDVSIQGTWNQMTVIAQMDSIKDPKVSASEKYAILSQYKDSLQLHDLIFIDKNGQALISDGKTIDLSEKDYFQQAITGNNYVTTPYQDSQDASLLILGYSIPVTYQNEIVGVLVLLQPAENLSQITSQIKVGESGQAFMLDKSGTTIAHTDLERVINKENIIMSAQSDSSLSELAELEKLAVSGENGASSYTFNDVEKLVGYAPIASTGWSICINLSSDEALSDIPTLLMSIIILVLCILLLSAVVTYFVSKSISKPIEQLSSIIHTLATGDFTLTIPNSLLKLKDETGLIAQNVSKLKNELGETLQNVSLKAQNLYQLSNNVDKNTSETQHSIEQIESAVQDIAAGSTSQAQETQEATQYVIKIGDMVEKARLQATALKDSTIHMQQATHEEDEIIQALDHITNQVQQSIDVIYDQTHITNQSVGDIHEAVNIITSIAEQTNLLSLNASIEAARAGEQGKGFAVVADEIRKLAEESDASAKKIQSTIEYLSNASEKAVQSMQDTKQIIQEQNEKIHRSDEIFTDVKKGIQNVVTNVDQILDHITALAEAKGGVIVCVENLLSLSEEYASSTEETSATTTEVNHIMNGIAASATDLQNMATELTSAMKFFKL